MLHLKHWDVSCPLLASIRISGSLGAISENDTVQRRVEKDRVQLRRTPSLPLRISVLSMCHQGDIAKGAPIFFPFFSSSFFFQVQRLGLAFVPLIISKAVMLTLKNFFLPLHASNEPFIKQIITFYNESKERINSVCRWNSIVRREELSFLHTGRRQSL